MNTNPHTKFFLTDWHQSERGFKNCDLLVKLIISPRCSTARWHSLISVFIILALSLAMTVQAAGNEQVSVTASPSVISQGGSTPVRVTVTCQKFIEIFSPNSISMKTIPVGDAAVTLSTTAAGVTFSPASGTTDSEGRFNSTLTITPSVSGDIVIYASARGSYYSGDGSAKVIVSADTMQREDSIDRIGSDYARIEIEDNDPFTCAQLCLHDARCAAATFVKPNSFQGPEAWCWMKDKVPFPGRNTDCITFRKIKDGSGGCASETLPVVDFNMTDGCPWCDDDLTRIFTDHSMASRTDPLNSVTWTITDSNGSQVLKPWTGLPHESFVFRFGQEGDYRVEEKVTTTCGLQIESGHTVTVTRHNFRGCLGIGNPEANFTMDPSSGAAPLNVTFTDVSSAEERRWDFGDGSSSSEINPVHRYAQPGEYLITLTVYGGCGDSMNRTAVIFVTSPKIPDTPQASIKYPLLKAIIGLCIAGAILVTNRIYDR